MQPMTLLGGLSPAQFMAEYWQKKPLLIRGAIPQFQGIIDADTLAAMACDGEVPARLIQCDAKRLLEGKAWQVTPGPLPEALFAKLPATDWTLLVQGVNHVIPEAQALLQQFNFIPTARLDDLMVSYAVKGGNVGPHLDSYDVFLLQGSGQRRWQISQQTDHTLVAEAPLKLLAHFAAEKSWVLEAGDMLYLPPQVAHWGIAESDDCMTYSIGFRAPAAKELAIEFLEACRVQGVPDQRYQDPDQPAVADPAAIPPEMVHQVVEMLHQLSWSPTAIGPFLARYLTEPKAYVVFNPPKKIAWATFCQRVQTLGVRLDLQSQMLHWQGQYYLNGEAITLSEAQMPLLSCLAISRQLTASQLQTSGDEALFRWLHAVYAAGYVHWSDDA